MEWSSIGVSKGKTGQGWKSKACSLDEIWQHEKDWTSTREDCSTERTGANLAVEAGRKSVDAEVMSMLQLQKKKPDKSTDDFGREQSLKPLSQNLYYGDLTATGKRKYSANDKIFFF